MDLPCPHFARPRGVNVLTSTVGVLAVLGILPLFVLIRECADVGEVQSG